MPAQIVSIRKIYAEFVEVPYTPITFGAFLNSSMTTIHTSGGGAQPGDYLFSLFICGDALRTDSTFNSGIKDLRFEAYNTAAARYELDYMIPVPGINCIEQPAYAAPTPPQYNTGVGFASVNYMNSFTPIGGTAPTYTFVNDLDRALHSCYAYRSRNPLTASEITNGFLFRTVSSGVGLLGVSNVWRYDVVVRDALNVKMLYRDPNQQRFYGTGDTTPIHPTGRWNMGTVQPQPGGSAMFGVLLTQDGTYGPAPRPTGTIASRVNSNLSLTWDEDEDPFQMDDNGLFGNIYNCKYGFYYGTMNVQPTNDSYHFSRVDYEGVVPAANKTNQNYQLMDNLGFIALVDDPINVPFGISDSPSTSTSPSLSPSPSLSTSTSPSLSPSLSDSPSTSSSNSPSTSLSPSVSLSPSGSDSPSVSPSPSQSWLGDLTLDRLELRDGGLGMLLTNLQDVTTTFAVHDGKLHMDGFTRRYYRQVLDDTLAKSNKDVYLDPRMYVCTNPLVDVDSEPSNQNPAVSGKLVQWMRADSIGQIHDVDDGNDVLSWPAIVGHDAFTGRYNPQLAYTGIGRYLSSALNGKPVLATSPSAQNADNTTIIDDWNGLVIGDKECTIVLMLKFDNLSSGAGQQTIITNTSPFDINRSGIEITMLDPSTTNGWRLSSWSNNFVTTRTFGVTDSNWHVWFMSLNAYLPGDDQNVQFPIREWSLFDGPASQITPTSSVNARRAFPDEVGVAFGLADKSYSNPFRGQISELRVYDGVLTAEDRTLIYNAIASRYGI